MLYEGFLVFGAPRGVGEFPRRARGGGCSRFEHRPRGRFSPPTLGRIHMERVPRETSQGFCQPEEKCCE
eukprot:12937946-Prorocentrum_lima.AAC.1